MEAVLEDNGNEIPKPPTSDAKDFAEWRKCVEKLRRIILEGVRDHVVSDTPYSMWKALTDMF